MGLSTQNSRVGEEVEIVEYNTHNQYNYVGSQHNNLEGYVPFQVKMHLFLFYYI